MRVRNFLANGNFNHSDQARQPDGSFIVTLKKRGDPHVYRMAVRDLYRAAEVVLWEEVDGVRLVDKNPEGS